ARQRAVLPALRRSPRGQDGCLALPAVPRARRRRRGAGADRDPAHREGTSIGASGAVAAAVAAYLLLQPRARVTAGVPVVVLPVLVQVPPFVPAALWGALQARPVTRLLEIGAAEPAAWPALAGGAAVGAAAFDVVGQPKAPGGREPVTDRLRRVYLEVAVPPSSALPGASEGRLQATRRTFFAIARSISSKSFKDTPIRRANQDREGASKRRSATPHCFGVKSGRAASSNRSSFPRST